MHRRQCSWAKLENGWAVKVSANLGEANHLSGQTVEVHSRSGATKRVRLGRRLDSWNGGRAAIYEVAR